MKFPNITQYKLAIRDAEAFKTLNDGIKPVMKNNEPVFAAGGFATVFKMAYKNKYFALKCFLKDVVNRNKRQQKIVSYIKNNPSPYFVTYNYLDSELWIDLDEGNEYPVAWMEWIEAPTLGNKIAEYCHTGNKNGLKKLTQKFKQLAMWLISQPFAHGDLKHDNILVKPRSHDLILVDYDGMFIPELSGEKAVELGGKDYQHPKRTSKDFNANIDDVSILIIYTSLLALTDDPTLFDRYNNGQNIIFSYNDLKTPDKSPLFKELEKKDFLNTEINSLKTVLSDNIIIVEDLAIYFLNSFNFEKQPQKWWENISEEWKNIIIENYHFNKKVNQNFKKLEINNIEKLFNKYKKEHKPNLSVDISKLFNEIPNINFLFIDKNIDNLFPILYFKNLTYLSISDNFLNLDLIGKLQKIEELHLITKI